jgi:hypothetical protein
MSNHSIFLPKMSVQQISDRIHMTNAYDIFHSNFYHQHPHIFKIIQILKLFQVNTNIKIKTTNSYKNQ